MSIVLLQFTCQFKVLSILTIQTGFDLVIKLSTTTPLDSRIQETLSGNLIPLKNIRLEERDVGNISVAVIPSEIQNVQKVDGSRTSSIQTQIDNKNKKYRLESSWMFLVTLCMWVIINKREGAPPCGDSSSFFFSPFSPFTIQPQNICHTQFPNEYCRTPPHLLQYTIKLFLIA